MPRKAWPEDEAGEHRDKIWHFANNGDLANVKRCLRQGMDPELRNKVGWTPLHAAAAGNAVSIMELLRKEGVDLSATDAKGRTAAHAAAQKGSLNALKWIHRHSPAQLSQRDSKGSVPLTLAQHKATVAFLVSKTEGAAKVDRGVSSEANLDPESSEPKLHGWDIPRGYGHRRRPFSGKAKKEQMQAKRAHKANWEYDKHHSQLRQQPDGSQGNDTALISAFGETELYGEKLHTLLERESDHSVQERRRDASRKLGSPVPRETFNLPAYPTELLLGASTEYQNGASPISMPRRPPFKSGVREVPEVVAQREEELVRQWAEEVCKSENCRGPEGKSTPHSGEGILGPFERNPQVWRQLWRLLERSQALLLVTPSTAPLLHFPAPALHAAKAAGIPAMAVVTKADLSPPECVAQWVTEIEQRFPYLSAVVAVRADMRGSSTSAGTVKAGSRSRWAGHDGDGWKEFQQALCGLRVLPPTGHPMQVGSPETSATTDEVKPYTLGEMLDHSATVDRITRHEDGWEETTCDDAEMVYDHSVGNINTLRDGDDEVETKACDYEGDSGKSEQGATRPQGEKGESASMMDQRWQSAAKWRMARKRGDKSGAPASRRYVAVGIVGEPNSGKSALINRMMGVSVAGVSATPGRTRRLQTLFLSCDVALLDCPGLIFPKRGVHRSLAVLTGNLAISQCREPFSAVRELCDYLSVEAVCKAHQVAIPDDIEELSPYTLMELFAEKWNFFTPKNSRPDASRAANLLLRMVLRGSPIALSFAPPPPDSPH